MMGQKVIADAAEYSSAVILGGMAVSFTKHIRPGSDTRAIGRSRCEAYLDHGLVVAELGGREGDPVPAADSHVQDRSSHLRQWLPWLIRTVPFRHPLQNFQGSVGNDRALFLRLSRGWC